MTVYRFGKSSIARLETCHPSLQEIAHAAISITPMDFTIIHGWRGEELQNQLFHDGHSKTPWPRSKHNNMEAGQPASLAIDFAPWHQELRPHVRWNRPEEFRWLGGFIMGRGMLIARGAGYALRWGGDWDGDGDHRDQTFMDVGHLELVPLPF